MTKKHFIALADVIKNHNDDARGVFGVNANRLIFQPEQIHSLANFCAEQNPKFDRDRWLGYIAGVLLK